MNFKLKLSIFLLLYFVLPGNAIFSQNEKLIYNQTFAPSEGFISKVEKNFRKEICLNGLWEFQAIPLPAGYKQGKGIAPELPLPKEGSWDKVKIKIPSPWNINAFATYNMEGPDHRNFPSYPKAWEDAKMGWMKKTIHIPSDWTNQMIKLHFEAVSGFTEVYVKDKKVAENFDIFLPFEADITNIVKPGETVDILVGVRNQSLFEDRSTIGGRIIPAGSMWGSFISGIWQDVYLLAVPKINIQNVFVKPEVSKGLIHLDITIANHSSQKEILTLSGDIKDWINLAGTDVNSAPVPCWELGKKTVDIQSRKIELNANEILTTTVQIPVTENQLKFWTPEQPNLYGLTLNLSLKNKPVDTKYERFGWREWTFQGNKQCLNGKPYELKGDSWHFMGVPQLTRRYAWAWFTAIKAANGNAVRPHAQVYPRFYLDMADEMGICVLDETAIWASDGGPKMDSPLFWDACKSHIKRLVQRDRNHASVFGWSVSNENKPVILNVFNKPELMVYQKQAWKDWRDIVSSNDPTRPWISSDGEDDGEGALPVTVGHYGDISSMRHWTSIGKPWGVGEHSMAYYGTPEQVSKYNGERAYESQQGRMEGLANECYHLIADQRSMGASYVSVFNLAWYSLKPLPFGKKDVSTPPSLKEDGIFFTDYKEGLPGIQPERMGPYCSTFNPGYDPNLPLYDPWPMFDAIRAANAPGSPAWSQWQKISNDKKQSEDTVFQKKYSEVLFIGNEDAELKRLLKNHGVEFTNKCKSPQSAILIIDGNRPLNSEEQKIVSQYIAKGADSWIWGVTPASLNSLNAILPAQLNLETRKASSYIPVSKSWLKGLSNSDFYFCEVQQEETSEYGLSGDFVREGEVLLNACNTDWKRWNKRPEEIKTASTVRSEVEAKGASPVFVKYQFGHSSYFVSALTHFANSEKGSKTLSNILKNAGIQLNSSKTSTGNVFFDAKGHLLKALRSPIYSNNKEINFIQEETQTVKNNRDLSKTWTVFSSDDAGRFNNEKDGITCLSFWLWSPRPLDDLLVEPDMPKLDLNISALGNDKVWLNNKPVGKFNVTGNITFCKELPLKQGWNSILIKIKTKKQDNYSVQFQCLNKPDFLSLLKASFSNPDLK